MERKFTDEDWALKDHVSAVRQNLAGPLPLFIDTYDAALRVALSRRQISRSFRSFRMFVLAGASLRTAVVTALSGATPQVVPLLRHALECAMYGYCFEKDRPTFIAWRDREKGKKEKELARAKLSSGKLIRIVEAEDESLAQIVRILYDELVSMGSHPNVMQVEPITKFYFEEGNETGEAKVGVLFGDTERATAFVWIGYTYEATMRLFQKVWPDDFLLLGIEASLRDSMFHLSNFRQLKAKARKPQRQ